MVIRRKSKQKRNRSSKRRTSRSKRVSKRTSRRKKTSRRKSRKRKSRKRKSLRKRKTSRKRKSINRRGGTLGFVSSLGTQASIGNVTGKLPTPASTMNTGENLNGNKTFNKVYRTHNDDNVQTPEAASRTSKFVFNNSIPGPAQTDEQVRPTENIPKIPDVRPPTDAEMSKWKRMQQYAEAFGHETMYHPRRGSEDFERWRNPLAYVPVATAIAARDIAKGAMNYVYDYTNPPPAVTAAEETDNPN